VQHLLGLARLRTPAESRGRLDDLDVSRRLENVLPEVARDIDAALRLPVPACARALLAVARQVAPDLVPPGAAEAVERVLARAEGAAR